jgi:hypothetical protein
MAHLSFSKLLNEVAERAVAEEESSELHIHIGGISQLEGGHHTLHMPARQQLRCGLLQVSHWELVAAFHLQIRAKGRQLVPSRWEGYERAG